MKFQDWPMGAKYITVILVVYFIALFLFNLKYQAEKQQQDIEWNLTE